MAWTPGDGWYPHELIDDPERPDELFARGDRGALHARRVAIVGTRRATAYGRNVARRLGAELTEAGVGVVSGLAIGIDGAAHEGVLAAGGKPVGVVATSLDVVYPRRHTALWEQVGREGLLLTETAPGQQLTNAWNFPRRNRIIAALAEIVIVVESTVKGGSMHTVNAAIKRGIDVMAVPGPVGSVASEGTNRLLLDGVGVCLGAQEVLDALEITSPRLFVDPPPVRRPRLSVVARRVFEVLDFAPMTTDRLVVDSGLSQGEVLVGLQELAATRRATGGGGWWSRVVR